MLHNKRKFVLGGVLAACLMATGASAASAAPATFSATGNGLWLASSTDQIKLSWGSMPWQNRTCTSWSFGQGATANAGGQGSMTLWQFASGSLQCIDGYGTSWPTAIKNSGPILANVNAGSYSLSSPRLEVSDPGPFGSGLIAVTTTPVSFSAPYTNGTTGYNGANPSKWTFSNTLVGYVRDSYYGNGVTALPLRITGTFKAGQTAPLTLIG